ncbi:MAG: hypothetical protein BroJett018_50090 [Chloroflexota bacterium]|nr:hypothetical protein [Chloroflexota bacterium]NOG64385.1 hypothetical protein [Chloroflexota bacterium]GIK67215.1 MAG: hypothetical protein BroJett018_50090 [Chloroflexota bacterium]
MADRVVVSAEAELWAFIESAPTLEEMADFMFSEDVQTRTSYLLDANRNGTLTAEEKIELDAFIEIEHTATMMKIRALAKLKHAGA